MLINYLEVVLNPFMAEALRNHYDTSLYIEAEGHLSSALVVLFRNGLQQLILQEGRTLQVNPEKKRNKKF